MVAGRLRAAIWEAAHASDAEIQRISLAPSTAWPVQDLASEQQVPILVSRAGWHGIVLAPFGADSVLRPIVEEYWNTKVGDECPRARSLTVTFPREQTDVDLACLFFPNVARLSGTDGPRFSASVAYVYELAPTNTHALSLSPSDGGITIHGIPGQPTREGWAAYTRTLAFETFGGTFAVQESEPCLVFEFTR